MTVRDAMIGLAVGLILLAVIGLTVGLWRMPGVQVICSDCDMPTLDAGTAP